MNAFIRFSNRWMFRSWAILFLALPWAGCSVLVGNVRPTEEPAPLDPAAPTPVLAAPWIRVPSQQKNSSSAQSGSLVPELSFQNQETGSTLAFTSGCRKSYQKKTPSLRTMAQSLGGGLSRVQKQEQQDILVSGVPALKSTISGWAGSSQVSIDNVVLARNGCIYDLTLVSLARHRDQDLPAFDKVLSSLPLSK